MEGFEGQQGQENLLSHRTVLLCVLLGLMLTVAHWVFVGPGWTGTWPLMAGLVATTAVHLLGRHHRAYWLSLTVLLSLWGTALWHAHLNGGPHSPALMGLPLVVVGVTVLLGVWQGQVALLLTLLALFLLHSNAAPPPLPSPEHFTVLVAGFTAGYFAFALAVLAMHRRSLQQILTAEVRHAKIQQQMELSEARNQAILDALPDMVFRVTRDTTIQDVSIGEQVKMPIQARELPGRKITEFLTESQGQEVLDRLAWVLSGDGMQTQELELTHPQTGMRTVESRMVQISEQHAILFWRDITGSKRVERENLARLRRMEVMEHFTRTLTSTDGEQLLQALANHIQQLLNGHCMVVAQDPGNPDQTRTLCSTGDPGALPHTVVHLPLKLHNNTFCTVSVTRSAAQPFSSEEQSALGTLVDRAGLTLTNNHLNQQNLQQARMLQEANTDLEKRIEARTHELAQLNRQLQELTIRDGLTGLFNRRHFDERLEQELRRLQRTDEPLSLLLCDIDHFKKYNDHYGHVQGDACLRQVAKALQGTFQRAGDVVARYGGEEFALVLPSTSSTQAVLLAERLKEKLQHLPHAHSDVAAHITLSIGVVEALPGRLDASELLKQADEALYCSKHSGRNRCTVHVPPVQQLEVP